MGVILGMPIFGSSYPICCARNRRADTPKHIDIHIDVDINLHIGYDIDIDIGYNKGSNIDMDIDNL